MADALAVAPGMRVEPDGRVSFAGFELAIGSGQVTGNGTAVANEIIEHGLGGPARFGIAICFGTNLIMCVAVGPADVEALTLNFTFAHRLNTGWSNSVDFFWLAAA